METSWTGRLLGGILFLFVAMVPAVEAQVTGTGGRTTAPPKSELVVGLGGSGAGGGWFTVFGNSTDRFVLQKWDRLPFTPYNGANGETRVACGDFDGDGLDEMAVGMGPYTQNGGWVGIFGNASNGYRLLAWVRVPWLAYDSARGETWPAAGDLDGDGRAELVVGLGKYTPQGGYLAVFDDARANYRFKKWLRVTFPAYNAANGETRPVVADLDHDGRAEIVVGLGSYPANGGWVDLFGDSATGNRESRWARLPWASYNRVNGETWPAVGDLYGDGKKEILLGQGRYAQNGGWTCVLRSSTAGYVAGGWIRLPWSQYNAANGEVRPATGDFDGDGTDEVALGMGKYTAGGGWTLVCKDGRSGFAPSQWVRIPWAAYNAADGSTRPASGRLKR